MMAIAVCALDVFFNNKKPFLDYTDCGTVEIW